MAEVVQRHLEEMLPEFEQAKKLGLFSEKEIKKIVRIRRRHEYRIIRRTKEKQCYLEYIKYESQLLRLVQLRREKMKLSKTLKKYEIDLSIKRRIERLFRSACHRFKKDVQLWLTFVEFLKKQKDFSTASSTFTAALQTHGNKSWLWILAAKFEFEVMVSPSTARSLFQRALRLISQDKKLWLEYFKFELLYVEMVEKRQSILDRDRKETKPDDEDAVLQGKIVEIVFENAQKSIENDPEFVCSFVDVLNEFSNFSFVENFLEKIYKTLEEKFSKKVLAKSLIARRPLNAERKLLSEASKKNQDVSFLIAVLEQQVRENYQELLSNSTDEKIEIWNFYLDFCLERLEKAAQNNKKEHSSICDKIFTEGNEQISFNVERFIQWISLIDDERKEIVLAKALEKHRNEPSIWEKFFEFIIKSNRSVDEIKEKFSEALRLKNVKKTPQIWSIVMEFAEKNDVQWLENLFIDSQSEKVDLSVSRELKPKFIRWAHKTKSLKDVREIFDRFSARIPASLDFFVEYIKVELNSRPVDHKRIRNAFEQAIIYFGQNSPELWLFYLDYSREHDSMNFVATSRIQSRAVNALDSENLKFFNAQSALKNVT